MNAAALSMMTACLIVAVAVGLFVNWQPQPHTILPPSRRQSEPEMTHQVQLNTLKEFDWYYGIKDQDEAWRDLNPFVPFKQRVVERLTHQRHSRPPLVVSRPPDPPPRAVPPLPAPPTFKKPKLLLPPFTGSQQWVPKVYGQLHMGDEQQVHVERDGEMVLLHPGDRIGDWTLKEIRPQHAVFEDGTGTERILPLGIRGGSALPEGE